MEEQVEKTEGQRNESVKVVPNAVKWIAIIVVAAIALFCILHFTR